VATPHRRSDLRGPRPDPRLPWPRWSRRVCRWIYRELDLDHRRQPARASQEGLAPRPGFEPRIAPPTPDDSDPLDRRQRLSGRLPRKPRASATSPRRPSADRIARDVHPREAA